MKCVTCIGCGWVHMSVSAEYVRDWEREWQVRFDNETPEYLESYGITTAPPKAKGQYLNCHRCNGSYKNFRDYKDGDMPDGCTISGILSRDEDWI